jgi:hypothetical protein
MQRVDFEKALKRVVEFGCAENVDWLFEQYGDVGLSQTALDDAVSTALTRGYPQVAQTVRARARMRSCLGS